MIIITTATTKCHCKETNKQNATNKTKCPNGHKKSATSTTTDAFAFRICCWYFRRTVHHITKCGQIICTQLYVRRCEATGWILSDEFYCIVFHFHSIFWCFCCCCCCRCCCLSSVLCCIVSHSNVHLHCELWCRWAEQLNVCNRSDCFFIMYLRVIFILQKTYALQHQILLQTVPVCFASMYRETFLSCACVCVRALSSRAHPF